MSKSATPFDSFNIDALKLGAIKESKAAKGCKTSKIQAGGRDVLLQTPPMTIPWDIVAKKMDEHSTPGANLSLSFTGIDENDENDDLNNFMKFMKSFDEKVKELIIGQEGALGKKSEDNVLEGNFKDSVKELQKTYEGLKETQDSAVAEVKSSGLALMKSVKAHKAKTGKDEL